MTPASHVSDRARRFMTRLVCAEAFDFYPDEWRDEVAGGELVLLGLAWGPVAWPRLSPAGRRLVGEMDL